MNKTYQIILFLLVFMAVGETIILGQGILKTFPDTLEYETQFERIQQLLIYNDGNSNITIDSIFVDQTYYEARFNKGLDFPVEITPGDSIIMDCILWNVWTIPYGNYDNTLIVYSNGEIK